MHNVELFAGRIALIRADITTLAVDAIVNAANSTLLGGGGVDGAIHQAAGPELLEQCRSLGGARPGEAKLTRGYRLVASHVIHTVGPVWHGGDADEATTLADCYRNTLGIALQRGFETIAFPLISTGAYRFPLELASRIALREMRDWVSRHDLPKRILVSCFSDHDLEVIKRVGGSFTTDE